MMIIKLTDFDYDSLTSEQQEKWIKKYHELREDYPADMRSDLLELSALLCERELENLPAPEAASEERYYRNLQVRYLALQQELTIRLIRRHMNYAHQARGSMLNGKAGD